MRRTNRRNCLLLLNVLFLMLLNSVKAQQLGDNQWGSWFMYFGTNKVSERWSIHSEVQLRYFEFADNFNQLLIRTGLNYHLNTSAIATLGYGYIATDGTFLEPPTDIDSREHRIFEQFILKNSLGKLNLEHRYRLEQRFISAGPSDDTQHRARYRLQLTLPLNRVLFLNVYDEIFLNLQNEVFGQNRAYAALGIRLSANSSLQVGYLKNHFPSINFDRLQLAIFFNPDLSSTIKNPSSGAGR